jgi:hypothetical protein
MADNEVQVGPTCLDDLFEPARQRRMNRGFLRGRGVHVRNLLAIGCGWWCVVDYTGRV